MDPRALRLPGGFDFRPKTRIVYGAGALAQLGAIAREVGGSRALLVTSPGVVDAGHAGHARECLQAAGFAVSTFADVRENPTTLDVDRCLEAARDLRPDLFVAVGGGSSIDAAKGANFLLTNGGAMRDYWGAGKAHAPLLPLIAVPTTAGTGSEVQSFTLIADETTHAKMACGDSSAAPRVAVLDPELTASVPRPVAAHTGVDTITHAVESAVTKARTPMSDLFAREAFRLANASLPRVLAPEPDVESRGAMLRAAAFAGLAIEESMLGAAHSLGNPLTAHHDLPHGEAVGRMLPHVVRYNAEHAPTALLYRDLASSAGLCAADAPPAEAAELLAARIETLLAEADLAGPLALPGADLDALAAAAAAQWTAQYNPRPVDAPALRALYRQSISTVPGQIPND